MPFFFSAAKEWGKKNTTKDVKTKGERGVVVFFFYFFNQLLYTTVHKVGHNPNVKSVKTRERSGRQTIPIFVFVTAIITAICEQNAPLNKSSCLNCR